MHKFPAHLYTNSLTFVEKPVSTDEIAIADVISKHHRALVAKDIAATLAVLSPGAKIKSLRNGRSVKLDKDFLAQHLEGLKTISFENIFIRLTGSSDAIVSYDAIFGYAGGIVKHRQRVWIFKKVFGTWRITALETYTGSNVNPTPRPKGHGMGVKSTRKTKV